MKLRRVFRLRDICALPFLLTSLLGAVEGENIMILHNLHMIKERTDGFLIDVFIFPR